MYTPSRFSHRIEARDTFLSSCSWSGNREIILRIQCWNSFVPMTPTFSECWWWDVVFIPEPVSLLQDLELLTQETTECWTHHSSRQRSLSQTSHYQVNIIMVSVDRGQQVNGGVLNCVVQLFEWSNRWQSTVLSNLVKKIFLILNIYKLTNFYLGIGWQSMISSCLNDWSNLVNSKIWNYVESWELWVVKTGWSQHRFEGNAPFVLQPHNKL